ncbi:DUF58 domain-containing protein [Candidatus Riflebacteria bacterium]
MSIRLTHWGRIYFAFFILLTAASINNGNNLIFLCVAVIFSIFVLSLLLGVVNITNFSFTRIRNGCGKMYAEEPLHFTIKGSKNFPAWNLELRELANPGFCILPEKIIFDLWEKSIEIPYKIQFFHRGQHQLHGFEIKSSFPFSFFEITKTYLHASEYSIYPIAYEVKLPSFFKLIMAGEMASTQYKKLNRAQEFSGNLREWQRGDPRKDIHWKVTAKLGHPIVRERVQENSQKITLFFGNYREKLQSFDYHLEIGIKSLMSLGNYILKAGYPLNLLLAQSDYEGHRPIPITRKEQLENICFALKGGNLKTSSFVDSLLGKKISIGSLIFLTLDMDEKTLPGFLQLSKKNPHLNALRLVSGSSSHRTRKEHDHLISYFSEEKSKKLYIDPVLKRLSPFPPGKSI